MSKHHSSTGDETRKFKGLQIYQSDGVVQGSWGYKVASQSRRVKYHVSRLLNRCDCPDFQNRGITCKHIFAVQYHLGQLEAPKKPQTVIELKKPTYRQQWKEYNAAQTSEKAAFQYFLAELCKGVVNFDTQVGRPKFKASDGVFCGAYKVYSMLSARRFTTDLNEAQAKGYISTRPHYNTVLKFLSNPWLTSLLKELITTSALPLKAVERDFAIDSTGLL